MSHAHVKVQETQKNGAAPEAPEAAHKTPQSQAPPKMPEAGTGEPQVVKAELVPPEDEGEAAQVREYLKKGYTFSQLTGQFGFKDRTVRREQEKLVPPQTTPGQKDDEPEDESRLPVTLKGAEVITPEGIIQRCLHDGSRDWELRMEGMMLLRAAQRMNLDDVEIMKGQAEAQARMMKPLLDTMVEISREQDAAARRAMGSNEEIAQRAALGVAQRLSPEIEALRSQIGASSAPDPFSRMLNLMQSLPQLMQTGQQLMQSLGMRLPGQPQAQGQLQGAPQSQPQTQWQPPPIERHSIAELEGKDAG